MSASKFKFIVPLFVVIVLFGMSKPAQAALGGDSSLGSLFAGGQGGFVYRYSVGVTDSSWQAYKGAIDFNTTNTYGAYGNQDLIVEMCLTTSGVWGTGLCYTLYNSGAGHVVASQAIPINVLDPFAIAVFQIRGHNLDNAGTISVFGRKVSIDPMTSTDQQVQVGQSFNVNWSAHEDIGVNLSAPAYCSPQGSVGEIGTTTCTPTSPGTANFVVTATGPGTPNTATQSLNVGVGSAPPPTCQDTSANNFGDPLPCTYPSGGGGGPPTGSGVGTVVVTSNSQDTYYVTGPAGTWGWNGSNTFTNKPNGPYSISAPGGSVSPAGSQTLASGGTITFNVTFSVPAPPTPPPPNPPPPPPPASGSFQITYTLVGTNIPTVTSINNSTCSKLTVNWSFSGTGLEDYFNLYRSTDNATWVFLSQVGIGARSYLDTPPDNTTYYYMLRSHTNAPYSRESGNSNSMSAFNQSCLANLSNSSKILLSDNGAAYTALTQIQTGDTLTFQITIANSGPSNATINYICDTPSSNVSNLRNLQVTGGTGGGITQSSPQCPGGVRLNVTGVKTVGNPNWVIKFDATVTTNNTSQFDQLSNTAVINFTDSQTRTETLRTGQILFRTGQGKAPNFREVAP